MKQSMAYLQIFKKAKQIAILELPFLICSVQV